MMKKKRLFFFVAQSVLWIMGQMALSIQHENKVSAVFPIKKKEECWGWVIYPVLNWCYSEIFYINSFKIAVHLLKHEKWKKTFFMLRLFCWKHRENPLRFLSFFTHDWQLHCWRGFFVQEWSWKSLKIVIFFKGKNRNWLSFHNNSVFISILCSPIHTFKNLRPEFAVKDLVLFRHSIIM